MFLTFMNMNLNEKKNLVYQVFLFFFLLSISYCILCLDHTDSINLFGCR